VNDINEAGGSFELEDILNYEIDESDALEFKVID